MGILSPIPYFSATTYAVVLVPIANSPMGKVKAALRQTALSKGVYLLKLKSQTGKSFSMKVLR